jgi:hypothetical protein
MLKSFIILTFTSTLLACNTHAPKQPNAEQLNALITKRELRHDSSAKVEDFQLERIDTLSQKEVNQACERKYVSYLKMLELDTLDAPDKEIVGKFGQILFSSLQNNLKRYLSARIDSLRNLIPHSDSLQPVAYYAECSFRVSNDIGSRTNRTWVLLDDNLKIVDEDEFFGLKEIIANGPLYFSKH